MKGYTIDKTVTDKEEVYSVNWYGKPMNNNSILVRLAKDGCVSIEIQKNYLYQEEAKVFADALFKALERHKERNISLQKQHAAKIGDLLCHYGIDVSLSINQTVSALTTRKIDNGKIYFDGVWLDLCRTDLKDDVRIKINDFDIEKLLLLVGFGARIDSDCFCIISAYSDG